MASSRPPVGQMVYWRFKAHAPGPWNYSYVSSAGCGLLRMGNWNGDTTGGLVIDPAEIEWKVKP